MLRIVALLSTVAIAVYTGRVGQCRTECVEQMVRSIVRVHLKNEMVMVGTCRNASILERAAAPADEPPFKSVVTPYICHRNIGLWTIDELDKEGVVKFNVLCPSTLPTTPMALSTCPRVDDNTPLFAQ